MLFEVSRMLRISVSEIRKEEIEKKRNRRRNNNDDGRKK